ncbi:MAG: hypothetical protein U9R74_05110 [Pseudomonadota bacterium]|nr:hypothetical protein [Pseudomonadota bacterium]
MHSHSPCTLKVVVNVSDDWSYTVLLDELVVLNPQSCSSPEQGPLHYMPASLFAIAIALLNVRFRFLPVAVATAETFVLSVQDMINTSQYVYRDHLLEGVRDSEPLP